MKTAKREIKNILLVRNDRFGEFLLTLPAISSLKVRFPKAQITLVLSPVLSDLVELIPNVDDVIFWESRKHSLNEIFALVKKLKSRCFDLSVIFNPSKEFNLISFLSNIPLRLGYDRKWGFLLTHKIKDLKHLCLKHEIECNLELVSVLGCSTSLKAPELLSEKLKSSDDFKKTIVLHPWASDPVKIWPLDYFVSLAKKIVSDLQIKVVIIGSVDNCDLSKQAFEGISPSIVNLTGKTNLYELAGLLKDSLMLISADSGPGHLASCFNVPVLAIFRNDLAGKRAIRWKPWGENNIILESDNLSKISVDDVFLRCKEGLKIK